MTERPVRIAGLTALRKDLKAAEAYEELAEIGAAFGEAAEMVRATAAARAFASGRKVDRALGESYKTVRSQAKAALRIGDKARPELLGNEFGAHRDVRRPVRSGNRTTVIGWRQFPEVVRGGRFVYPAAAQHSEDIINLLGDRIVAALSGSSDSGEDE